MNLTDGRIFCGRKFFDGTGGNNHAVEHYKESNHPLAVKLGTIIPIGGGEDVGLENLREDKEVVCAVFFFRVTALLFDGRQISCKVFQHNKISRSGKRFSKLA